MKNRANIIIMIPLAGYLSIATTLYYTLLCIDHYSVQSLFVQAWFVATITFERLFMSESLNLTV
jgi:hypothetical protein